MRHVYFDMSQSNGMGRAPLTPPVTFANAARMHVFRQPAWNAALTPAAPVDVTDPGAGTWTLASEPLCSHPQAGFGPYSVFMDRTLTLENDPALEIGFVVNGWGGRGALDWTPRFDAYSPFTCAIERIKRAVGADVLAGGVMCFGETDAISASPDYMGERMYELVDCVRRELWGADTLPIVVAQLWTPAVAGYPGWNRVRELQGRMANCDPYLGVVDVAGLAGNPGDPVHLNQPSQIARGTAMADRMFQLRGGYLPPVPFYRTNPGAGIVASASASTLQQPAANLVNGLFGNTIPDATWFPAGSAVAGKWIQFDFPAPVVLVEARLSQSDASQHATWQWQALDGANWVNIGATFTLGGAYVQIMTTLNGNVLAAVAYRLLGVSGNVASPQPWIHEIEFKY